LDAYCCLSSGGFPVEESDLSLFDSSLQEFVEAIAAS